MWLTLTPNPKGRPVIGHRLADHILLQNQTQYGETLTQHSRNIIGIDNRRPLRLLREAQIHVPYIDTLNWIDRLRSLERYVDLQRFDALRQPTNILATVRLLRVDALGEDRHSIIGDVGAEDLTEDIEVVL